MALFMVYDGITGEHTVGQNAGMIKLESFTWGLTRNASNVSPALRSRSEPSFSEISCTKEADGSSIALLNQALTGKFDTKIIIRFVRQGTHEPLTYLEYTLENAGISSLNGVGSFDGTPLENFTLSFTSISVCHTVYEDDLTGIPSFAYYSLPDAA